MEYVYGFILCLANSMLISKSHTPSEIMNTGLRAHKNKEWVVYKPGGGVLRFGLGGSARLTPQNPHPFLGVILAENSTRF